MSAYWGLLIAVIAVSWSSIFIRWCGDVPALVISFYRLLWSTLLFLLYQLLANPRSLTYPHLTKKSKLLIFLAGILLALHFGTWIASVQNTLISHALILGSIHPVFALLLSPLFLKERGSWLTVLAAAVTLMGIVLIGGQDFHLTGSKFIGDLLAVISALFVTIYILIARHQRQNIDFIPYLIAVYAIAALTLFFMILLFQLPIFQYSLRAHLFMLFLALIPTGIGHTLINWAARRIEIYKVNFSILGEPVISSVLAYIFFGEKPYGLFYLGALFIIGGILLALTERKSGKF